MQAPGFMKKLPANAEASNVLVGEVDFLERPITAFVRLASSAVLGGLTEVPIPTRFLFIMLGPSLVHGRYHEIGRAISTLMADEVSKFFVENLYILASMECLGLVSLFECTMIHYCLLLYNISVSLMIRVETGNEIFL